MFILVTYVHKLFIYSVLSTLFTLLLCLTFLLQITIERIGGRTNITLVMQDSKTEGNIDNDSIKNDLNSPIIEDTLQNLNA